MNRKKYPRNVRKFMHNRDSHYERTKMRQRALKAHAAVEHARQVAGQEQLAAARRHMTTLPIWQRIAKRWKFSIVAIRDTWKFYLSARKAEAYLFGGKAPKVPEEGAV